MILRISQSDGAGNRLLVDVAGSKVTEGYDVERMVRGKHPAGVILCVYSGRKQEEEE